MHRARPTGLRKQKASYHGVQQRGGGGGGPVRGVQLNPMAFTFRIFEVDVWVVPVTLTS